MTFLYLRSMDGVLMVTEVFIYMADKSSFCDQLRKIIESFRRLEQDPEEVFAGM